MTPILQFYRIIRHPRDGVICRAVCDPIERSYSLESEWLRDIELIRQFLPREIHFDFGPEAEKRPSLARARAKFLAASILLDLPDTTCSLSFVQRHTPDFVDRFLTASGESIQLCHGAIVDWMKRREGVVHHGD
jgi:hypothetical protein